MLRTYKQLAGFPVIDHFTPGCYGNRIRRRMYIVSQLWPSGTNGNRGNIIIKTRYIDDRELHHENTHNKQR